MAERSGKKAEYRSARRSRRMIKTAFLELLREKELKKITVTDIVNRCGLNRGTFYSHYTGVSAVIEQIENELIAAIEDVLEPPENDSERTVYYLLKKFTELLKSDVEYYRLVVNCGGEQFASKFRDFLLARMKKGDLLVHKELSEVEAQFMIGGFVAVYLNWFQGKTDCTLEELGMAVDSIISASAAS
ncbi:MAG: TetR/AcrR family transcriptional regulator [Clostridia bacterium]|nr:TetR/AcrR family transcriptional regulator [Clostridia bacterium]